MRRLLVSSLVLVALAAAAGAAASTVRLTVSPSTVTRGGTVHISGNADGCRRGNTVFVISRAFVHTHEFAGVSAVLLPVRAGGAFGGGNLGVLAHVTVRR